MTPAAIFFNGITTTGGVTIGGGLTTGTINVNPQGNSSSPEGGEIVLLGSGSNEDINIDNYYGNFRIFDGSTPTVRLNLDSNGNATFAGAINASGTIKTDTAFGGFITLKRSDTTTTNNSDIGAINFEHTDSDDAGVAATILVSGDGAGGAKMRFYTGTPTSRAERLTIGSTGVVKVTNSSWAELHLDGGPGGDLILKDNGVNYGEIYAGNGHGMVLKAHSGQNMFFLTNGVATARAVIDSSGNFLAGKTTSGFGTVGVELAQSGTSGKVWMTRSGGEPLALNRLSSDGSIIDFFKDGSQIGSIKARTSDLLIGTADVGLRFDDNAQAYIPFNVTTSAGRDAAIDLGHASVRYKDLYLSGKSPQTLVLLAF